MNTEIIMKAKEAKSAEELVKIARENGLELSQSGAEQLFGELHRPSGELSDSELESAVGGCGLRDYFAKDTSLTSRRSSATASAASKRRARKSWAA